MFIRSREFSPSSIFSADVAVVGAGPAGITLALELARGGLDVILIESGGLSEEGGTQSLSVPEQLDRARHEPAENYSRRQLGGATVIWGGRCVPFDPVDFAKRPFLPDSEWPIGYSQVARFHQSACDYFQCGDAVFDLREMTENVPRAIIPGFPEGNVTASTLERWSLPTDFGRAYREELRRSDRIRVLLGLTCTRIELEPGGNAVSHLVIRNRAGEWKVSARQFVLAAGGLESTRLLLASGPEGMGGIGNHSGMLGRFYMGHISGRIAKVHFATPPERTVYGYLRDRNGVYLRPRLAFTQKCLLDNEMLNIVGWLANPPLADASHGNGVLSAVYLLLASPAGRSFAAQVYRDALMGGEKSKKRRHWLNVVRDLHRVAAFFPAFAWRRYLTRRKAPGFFEYDRSNTYTLHYHGEQSPNPDSRVSLGETTDALGLRRLRIDLKYSYRDVENVLLAHRLWDDFLRGHRLGFIEYLHHDLEQAVWSQARDGLHQAGTTRMSSSPEGGVVDEHCRVHGTDNLFIASGSVFVTSSQANTTFLIVVLALRLAEYLKTIHSH